LLDREQDVATGTRLVYRHPAMTDTTKTLKTAPELERYILNELRSCSACSSISAVTVSEAARADSNWEVSHINAIGGTVPNTCAEICADAVARLRERFDLVIEIEPEDD
jgi:hypothetical protein